MRPPSRPGTIWFLALVATSACAEPPVEPPPAPPNVGPAVVATITPDAPTIAVGDTLRFHATILEGQAARLIWVSSDTLKATFDSSGLLTALAAGVVPFRVWVVRPDSSKRGAAGIVTIR